MSNAETITTTALLVGRLAVERAQMNLAHLHALLHLCTAGPLPESFEADCMRQVIENLERELKSTAFALDACE